MRLRRLWIVLAIALVVRLAAAGAPSRPLVSDERDYDALARGLAREGEYAEDGRPTAYRAPGYPLFLAGAYLVAGPDPRAVRVVQAVLDVGAVALVYAIAAAIQPAAGLAAALVWALYPPAVIYARLILPETLFTFLLLFWTLLAVRAPWERAWAMAALGAGVGLLAWVKPASLLLLLTLPLAPWSRGLERGGEPHPRLLRAAIPLLLGAAVAVAPWVARNARVMGAPVFTTGAGPVLLIGSQPGATGGFVRSVSDSMARGFVGEVAADHAARAEALDHIRREPLRFIRTGLAKWALLVTLEVEIPVLALHPNPADPTTSFREKLRSLPAVTPIVASVAYAMVLLAGLAGFLAYPGGRLGAVAAAVVAAWLIAHFVFIGGTRYHQVFMPLAAIYAGRLVAAPRAAMVALDRPRVVGFALATAALVAIWLITIGILLRP
jgi:4-amino-4-deoxy-L-arabinose transferase-like glycosyltransferase